MSGYTGSIADSGRVIHIAKRRERHKEDIELKKRRIAAENAAATDIGHKFAAHYDAVEQQLKSSTVGLVTLEEMKAARENYVREREKQLASRKVEAELVIREAKDQEENERKRALEQKQKSCLSFDFDEDGDEADEGEDEYEGAEIDKGHASCIAANDDTDGPSCSSATEPLNDPTVKSEEDAEQEPVDKCLSEDKPQSSCDSDSDMLSSAPRLPTKRRLGKDPTVDTSFLPDRDREEEEDRLREQLRLEWIQKQDRVKNEELNVAFSYWDGSGHRRDVKMKKGQSIYALLTTALDMLRKDFNELKAVSADSLMFVKEDLIIPHFYTFHDFIVTKAMGKTGPLFEFDAAGELRIRQDASRDKAESHPAKVVLRSWYERNKHIYPASRWEPFDPNKRYDGRSAEAQRV